MKKRNNKEKAIDRVISIRILFSWLGVDKDLKIAEGIVSVCKGIIPTTTTVAPNSPRLRAKEIKAPRKIPNLVKGKITFKKVCQVEFPKTKERSSNFLGTVVIAICTD